MVGGSAAHAGEGEAGSRPGRTEMRFYGAGEIASNLSWNMVNGFLLYYYTDVARIPAAPLVWLFLLTKIFDAFIDIGAGAMVDRTRSRWGHARPYLLFASVPFSLMCILAFSVPDTSLSGKIVYAFITYGLLGLGYSLVYVPYAALQPLLSNDPRDHNLMGGLRSMGTSIASIIVFATTQPLVALAGGGQTGFTVAAVVFGIGTVALYVTVFANTRERIQTSASAPAVWVAVGRMARNRAWLGAFSLMLINFFRVITLVSVLPYVAKLLFGNIAMLGVFLTLQSGAVLLGSLVAGPLMNRFSVARVNIAGVVVAVAMFAAMSLAQGHTYLTLALFTLASAPIGIFTSTAFSGCSKAASVQERLFGSRDEGLLAAGLSFGQKVGGAIGTALIAFLLSQANYDPGKVSEAVVATVRMAFYWLQVGLLVLHFLPIYLLRSVDPSSDGAR
jgi:GPH family glycoside/pentoside/hexuronide:cation symporter